MRRKKTHYVKDGELVRHRWRNDGSAVVYTKCCGCGLVHLEWFKPKKAYLAHRAWRREKAK